VIRPFHADDADAVAALLHQDKPPHPVTGAGIRHWLLSQPERAGGAVWVAERGGAVVGWVRARLRWATTAQGVGELWAFVATAARRSGLGTGLYDAAHVHLLSIGARVLESWATGEEGGRFLLDRGFREVRRHEILRLDLASADLSGLSGLLAASKDEGYELVPLAAVADRPEGVYAVDASASADVPGTYPEDDLRLDDWRTEALGHPQLSLEGSSVVLASGAPVAYAFLHVDPEARLAANEMTGTHPDHRRRGLARLAKLGTIAWAREQGYESIRTENARENAGMLHLNKSLGYRPVGVEAQYLREDLR
jgi:GNAT superfamily N-acetyltransferase